MFQVHGELHHTWFMARGIYIMKLAMLAHVTPPGLITPNMLAGIDRMSEFIALFYNLWFL